MDSSHVEPLLPLGRLGPDVDAFAPDGSQIRFLMDGRHGARLASLVEVTLPVGQVSRPVWHRTVEEVWYILAGLGQVWRCPSGPDPTTVEAVPVEPGDALVIPTGWRFQFSSEGDVPLRFLCYTSPPWPGPEEAQFAECGVLGGEML